MHGQNHIKRNTLLTNRLISTYRNIVNMPPHFEHAEALLANNLIFNRQIIVNQQNYFNMQKHC